MTKQTVLRVRALATRELEMCANWRLGVCIGLLPLLPVIALWGLHVPVTFGTLIWIVCGLAWVMALAVSSALLYTRLALSLIRRRPDAFIATHQRECWAMGDQKPPVWQNPATWLASVPAICMALLTIAISELVPASVLVRTTVEGPSFVAYIVGFCAVPCAGYMADRLCWIWRGRGPAAKEVGLDGPGLMHALGYRWLWWYGWELDADQAECYGYAAFDAAIEEGRIRDLPDIG